MKSLNFCLVFSILFASYLQASPEQSQRLRGLGGRSFAVEVTDLSGMSMPFSNCYTFNTDASWDDPQFLPGFPVPGTWSQDSNGAATSYTATAVADVEPGVAVLLTQVGTITPAGGGGVLQLDAYNSVDIVLSADHQIVLAHLSDLTSVGHQVDECPSEN